MKLNKLFFFLILIVSGNHIKAMEYSAGWGKYRDYAKEEYEGWKNKVTDLENNKNKILIDIMSQKPTMTYEEAQQHYIEALREAKEKRKNAWDEYKSNEWSGSRFE